MNNQLNQIQPPAKMSGIGPVSRDDVSIGEMSDHFPQILAQLRTGATGARVAAGSLKTQI